jgi:hypothetical protein
MHYDGGVFERVDWTHRGALHAGPARHHARGDEGIEHGVNGWRANEKDRRLYQEAGADGQED